MKTLGLLAMLELPVSILYKFIAGRYRPVRIADGPITARYRFIKNASWVRLNGAVPFLEILIYTQVALLHESVHKRTTGLG